MPNSGRYVFVCLCTGLDITYGRGERQVILVAGMASAPNADSVRLVDHVRTASSALQIGRSWAAGVVCDALAAGRLSAVHVVVIGDAPGSTEVAVAVFGDEPGAVDGTGRGVGQ